MKCIKPLVLVGFWVTILTISCDSEKRMESSSPDLEVLFSNTQLSLRGEVLRVNVDSLSKTFSMIVIDSLLVMNSPSRNHLFKIVDLKRDEFIKNYGKKGNGPSELGFPSFIQRIPDSKQNVAIFSKNAFTFYEASVSEILQSSDSRPRKVVSGIDFNTQQVARVKDSKYIAVGIYPNRFAALNSNGDTVKTFLDYPFRNEYENFGYQTLAMAFQGGLIVKPDGSRAIFAAANSANFDIINLDDFSDPTLVKSIHSWKPSFSDQSSTNSLSIAVKRDNRFGYIDLSVSDNFIYLLLSGRTMERYGNDAFAANRVLVFDWDGEPVRSFLLEKDTRTIAVDESDNNLYAFIDEEDPLILKYALPKK